MASIQEWAKHEEQLKQTSRLQVNLQSWEEGDILHFYQDLVVMFQELQSDDIVSVSYTHLTLPTTEAV